MAHANSSGTYLYFDGDDVGAAIELRLLESDIDGASEISARVSSSVQELSRQLESLLGATIVFAAGDEVLARLTHEVDVARVDILRKQFLAESGLTISCGIGRDPKQATLSLHVAKLRGKNRIQDLGDE